MCLAIPVRVTKIKKSENTALGEIGGVEREIRTEFVDDLKENDYVLLHAGFAIQKVDEKEAKKTLSLLEEIYSKDKK